MVIPGLFLASGSRHGVQFLTSGAGHYREVISRMVVTASPDLRRAHGEPARLHRQGDALQFPLENFQRIAHESYPADRIAGSFGRNTVAMSSQKELAQLGGVLGVKPQQQFAP